MEDLLFFPVVEVTVKYTQDELLAMASVSVKRSSIWQTCPCGTDCKSRTRQAIVAAREVLQKGVMYAVRAQISFIPSPCFYIIFGEVKEWLALYQSRRIISVVE